MLIGINGYEAVVPRFGYDSKTSLPIRVGSGEYCFELLLALNKIDKKNNYIVYLPCDPTSDLPKESEEWHYKVIGPRKFWTLISLSLEFLFKRSNPDVFFSPTHYLPVVTPKRNLISILDVSYIHFPEAFRKSDLGKLNEWTKFSVKKAKGIFTISNSSRDDIMKTYRFPDDKVWVTYPGIKEMSNVKCQMSNMDEIRKKYGINKDYILFVGTIQPRKNIIRLIEAFSKIVRGPAASFLPANAPHSRQEPLRSYRSEVRVVGNPSSGVTPLQLIIIGKKGWKFEEILSAPKKFRVENKVKFLDSISDQELPEFYKNAVCFVLPSLYEGFGLPILEAMKYGCPVIISNISSLPEAGGDAVLYVDPLNAEDITKKLKSLIEDNSLREKLIKKGYEQIKKFSWEKTAKETLDVLTKIANE